MPIKKVETPDPPEEKAKKNFAVIEVQVTYKCPFCGRVIGSPDVYQMDDDNKHMVSVEDQAGPCECGKEISGGALQFARV